MWKLHTENELGCDQQPILISLFVKEHKVSISEAEEIELGKLAIKVTGTAHFDAEFADLLKSILNSAIAFREIYRARYAATQILDIVKDITGSGTLERMRSQPYDRYIWATKMTLKQEGILAVVESLSGHVGRYKQLGIYHLHDVRLHTENT